MKAVIYYFIKYYKVSSVIFLAGLLAGIAGLMGLRREARPPVDFGRVTITTAHPGADSAQIEELITEKLEHSLHNINGIRHSYSVSSPGLSQITLFLDLDNTDTDHTVTEIHRAVQNVPDLPSNLLEKPLIRHEKAEEIPIMSVALVGDHLDRNRIAHALKLRLQNIPNVAQVQLTGFQKKEYQVLLDGQKVQQNSVSLSEVLKAIRAFSQDVSAGLIQDDKTKMAVRMFGKIKNVKDLENIVIRSNFSHKRVLVKDIATVQNAEEQPYSTFFVHDKPAVSLQITKKAKTDSIQTIKQIKKFFKQYTKTLDSNLSLVILFDESEKTKLRLSIVTNNALFGLVLVLLILLICLPGWLGAMSSLSLPFSILCAVAIVSAMGVTFNVITMCAFVICIGMLVDNSIVISERYARLRAEKYAPDKAALQSVLDLWKPVFATTATTVLAFLPMLLTKGVMGQFVRWIPIVVSIALVVSLFEAFFLLPCRLRWTIARNQKKAKTSRLWQAVKKTLQGITTSILGSGLYNKLYGWHKNWSLMGLKNTFQWFIQKALGRHYLSLMVLLGVTVLSLGVGLMKNRFILFPKENVERYMAYFELDKNLSLKEMEKHTSHLTHKVLSVLGNDFVKLSFANINSLTGKGQLTIETDSKTALKEDYKEVLTKLRTVELSVFNKLRFQAFALGPPVGRPVELILFSQDEEELNNLAEEVKTFLSSIDGLLNIEDGREYSGPEYAVYPDTEKLSRLKLDNVAVGQALKTALHGSIVAELTDKGESFYVRVKYDEKGRSHIDFLKNVPIYAGQGQMVPLNKVINLNAQSRGPEIKKHYAFMSSVTFYADVDLKKITSLSANAKIQKKMEQVIKKYPAVSYKQVGERESTKESLQSLIQAMIVVVFGIFAILLLMFNSFSVAILILSSVLLGFVGISWSFLLHSRPLSFFALIGAVGLAGVVINSSIILVSFIEKTKKEHPEQDLKTILVRSAIARLKPILITTITTVLGLFPTAYGIGGHDSVLIPITLSLTWGLISGSLLTLVWIPCGYLAIYGRSSSPLKK